MWLNGKVIEYGPGFTPSTIKTSRQTKRIHAKGRRGDPLLQSPLTMGPRGPYDPRNTAA